MRQKAEDCLPRVWAARALDMLGELQGPLAGKQDPRSGRSFFQEQPGLVVQPSSIVPT